MYIPIYMYTEIAISSYIYKSKIKKKTPKAKHIKFCIKMPPFIMILNKHKRLKPPM